MSTITLHPGDNRASLRRLIDEGVRVHSVVTDPPYGLVSISKRFGKDGAAPALHGTDGAFARASAGFMGSKWDGTGIERDPEFWQLIHDILLPGGYVLAFSSARTGHWQACAMEQAGFVIHPFLGWTYGSGMPKAHNAAMAIDKHLGVKSSPEAADWEGWAYGAQSLKPALEPIYVGQKPFSEKNGALNILKHGVGAMNIDACRVATDDPLGGGNNSASVDRSGKHEGWQRPWMEDDDAATRSADRSRESTARSEALGRWPAYLLHDGSDDVLAMFPNDNGRFFNSFPADQGPLFYHSKATKADRAGSKHPTVKPIALMRWLCRLVTPVGGTVLDPFGGSGTTGQAALDEGFACILMEAEQQFIDDIRSRFNLDRPLPDDIMDLLGESELAEDLCELL